MSYLCMYVIIEAEVEMCDLGLHLKELQYLKMRQREKSCKEILRRNGERDRWKISTECWVLEVKEKDYFKDEVVIGLTTGERRKHEEWILLC